MLTQLELFNSRVSTPPFAIEAGSPASDPLRIRRIDGLGPVDASVNTSSYGQIDGESYSGSSIGKRNIVLTIGFNPNWIDQRIESLRAILYKYVMPKSRVRMRFTSTHMPTVEIFGYVESCEPNIFSQDPEMQVSIICPEPYFKDVSATVVNGVTQAIGATTGDDIDYEGSVDAGFVLYVEKGSGSDYTGPMHVVNAAPNQEFFLLSEVTVNATDYVDLSTLVGGKYVRKAFVAGGPSQNIMRYVSASSTWSLLKPGVNEFRVLAAAGLSWTMRYHNRYGGL